MQRCSQVLAEKAAGYEAHTRGEAALLSTVTLCAHVLASHSGDSLEQQETSLEDEFFECQDEVLLVEGEEKEEAASNDVEADLNDVLDPPPAAITTSEVKQLAGIYTFVKGDGSCPI